MKLAQVVEDYVDLKRSIGFRFRTAGNILKAFGREAGQIDVHDVSQQVVASFLRGPRPPIRSSWQIDNLRLGGAVGYCQRPLLYHNLGDRTFDEVAAQFGPALMEERVSRGLAVGDLDNDGRLDVVINGLDGAPQVLHNELSEVGNWLIVRVKGKGMNTDAIGAIVTATVGRRSLMRLVQSGTSYLSQDDMRQHFGLGREKQAAVVEVRWPDGTTTEQDNVKANQILKIEQPR